MFETGDEVWFAPPAYMDTKQVRRKVSIAGKHRMDRWWIIDYDGELVNAHERELELRYRP